MTTEQRHDTAPSPGFILKSAREQRGLSQSEVAHRLKLRIALIRDIEQDRFDQKTASTFTRGYLKTYARFVGANEDVVLAAYDQLGFKDQQYSEMYSFSGRTQREASEHRVRFISWFLFIGLAGLGGTWWWMQPAEEPVPTAINEAGQLVVKSLATPQNAVKPNSETEAQSQAPIVATSAASPTVTKGTESNAESNKPHGSVSVENTTTGSNSSVLPDNEGQEPTVLTNAAAEPDEQEQTKIIPASATSAANSTPPVNSAPPAQSTNISVDSSVALQLQFNASCWLKVTDSAGKSLFEGSKVAGDKMNLTGKEPFNLTIGAPRAVSVYFHGQAVDMSSYIRQGVVARYKLPLKN